MSRPAYLLLAAGLLATGACASSPAAADGAAGRNASTARTASGPSTLLAADIAAAPQENLRDVVNALRPRWFQNNAAGSINARGANGGVLVFVNGQAGGGVDALGQIAKSAVERISYYTLSEAQARYGSRVRGPVIDVRLRTGG